MITGLHHVSYVVANLAQTVNYLRDHLGLEPSWIGEDRGRHAAIYYVGDAELQIKEPTDPEDALAVFLRERGPGVNHVAWATHGLDQITAGLVEAGSHLQHGSKPFRSDEGSLPHHRKTYRVVNVEPSSGHGLGGHIQLIEEDE